MIIYIYGMRLRPYSPGCQPKSGLLGLSRKKIKSNKDYYNILIYDRELTEDELKNYELDFINSKRILKEELTEWIL